MFNLVSLRTLSMASLALVTVLLTSIDGKADTTGICNTDGPGQCTASVSLSGNLLTITVTNTSPPANQGFITAVAFNLGTGTATSNFTTTNANFALFGPAPTGWDGNVAPNGTRTHLISATSNQYEGGGSPNGGVDNGVTAIFTVTLTGGTNTELGIFNSILVRQRGFDPDNSDKDELIITQVPEPTSMLLLGTGLLGVAAGIRRRRRR